MTTREIQGHLEEIYGVEVSPGLVSAATDAVLEKVRAWQTKVAADLKLIYTATTLEEAENQLLEFVEKWETRYPVVARSWQSNWARIVPMFQFTPEIRRAIYTTNAIESLNFSLRKIIKNRALFPNDEAVYKILFLALRNIAKKWTMPIPKCSGAMNQFATKITQRL